MNYIKEINAFYDRIEMEPLSASAVTLWHTLMHMNNKARWVEQFTVAATVLRLKSGLKESSFKRARIELKEKGYIDYKSRPNNQAPVYRMVQMANDEGYHAGYINDLIVDQLVEEPQTNQGDRVMDHHENHPKNQTPDQPQKPFADQQASPNMGTLIKLKQKENKQKQDEVVAAEDTIAFYQDNIGLVSPYVAESLLQWVRDIGEALVIEAMKRALERNKPSWGYVKSILQAWVKKGIVTVDDAMAEDVAFRNQRGQRKKEWGSASGRQGRDEIVPEWFEERKRGNEQLIVGSLAEEGKNGFLDLEEMKRELREMMAVR
ncbi:hypothetical protein CWR48_03245 [Oceanobacillus arenosus]|uniref:DnaB/C C-terminal domain-containing protein n=1 Tax=Oceanobacillus arenosus TaxID=1229153 RepID=A0A3D8Q1J4_9BACI|nr:DnaD domain protein [Oceanobacillus arenosus]RDW21431.1 hypothetical protein CWR48_03245 [Oceanobacillus arenosus]